MKKAILMGAASFLCAAIVSPASANTVQGYGAAKCGEMIELLQDQENFSNHANSLVGWITGYFSGRNAENPENLKRDFTNLDPFAATDWVLDQCSLLPSARIWEFADLYYEQLPYLSAGV